MAPSPASTCEWLETAARRLACAQSACVADEKLSMMVMVHKRRGHARAMRQGADNYFAMVVGEAQGWTRCCSAQLAARHDPMYMNDSHERLWMPGDHAPVRIVSQ